MQIEKYYNDLNTLHINTEKNRAYYMPCSDIENARKGTNDRKQDLNGEWNFMYYTCIDDVPEDFKDGNTDGFDKIPVPLDSTDRPAGKMTAINIQIQDIRFRIIRRMFRMTIRAVRM